MSVSVKIGSTWRNVDQLYIKIGGAWRKVSNVFTKVSGQWKPAYSYNWNIGAWSACSVSCGGGTQSRVVTCVRNDGKTVEDSLCGSKPVTSQVCNTQACQPVGECGYNIDTIFEDMYKAMYWYVEKSSGRSYAVWKRDIDWLNNNECQSLTTDYCINRGYRYYKGVQMQVFPTGIYYQICRTPV